MNESRINLENLPFFLCFGYKTVFLIFQKQLWSFGIRGTSSLGLLSTYFPRTGAKRTHVLTFNQYISDVYVDVGTYMAIFFLLYFNYNIQKYKYIPRFITYACIVNLSHFQHTYYISVGRTYFSYRHLLQ